jgi:hypothetical protein
MSAISAPDAIAYLAFCVSWGGGEIPLFTDGAARPRLYLEHHGAQLAALAQRLDRREHEVQIGLAESQHGLGPAQSTILWAWVESKDSAQRAWRRFRPTPAVVLRMGSSCRRLCIWPLREALPWVLVENSNKRIAYALHAPQKYALPEKLRIPVPGTSLRAGRKRPVPVLPTRLETDAWTREQLVGRLKEPPPPWRPQGRS